MIIYQSVEVLDYILFPKGYAMMNSNFVTFNDQKCNRLQGNINQMRLGTRIDEIIESNPNPQKIFIECGAFPVS